MPEYIFKNKEKLMELLKDSGLASIAGLSSSTNTIEFRKKIDEQPISGHIYNQLCRFFILKHIYDYSGKTYETYSKAIKADLKELLGPNPAHKSVKIQRTSGLRMPFKTWTRRTALIQFSVILTWVILILFLHIKYPELWIFTFHLPISGLAILFFPGLVLTLISPRFLGQKRFEDINTLEELVDKIYNLNREDFQADNFTMLNQKLKRFVDG